MSRSGNTAAAATTVMYQGKTVTFQFLVETFKDMEKYLAQSAESKGILVLDIFSTWSGPCNAMASTFRTLYVENECREKPVKFLRVDAMTVLKSVSDDSQKGKYTFEEAEAREAVIALLKKYSGRSKPTFALFKNGEQRKILEGADVAAFSEQFLLLMKELDEEMKYGDEEEEVESPKKENAGEEDDGTQQG